jgi:hypothetical protein
MCVKIHQPTVLIFLPRDKIFRVAVKRIKKPRLAEFSGIPPWFEIAVITLLPLSQPEGNFVTN